MLRCAQQDEVLRIKAEEEQEAAAERAAADAAARAAALQAAHLTTVAQLPQDLGDPLKHLAWTKLQHALPPAAAAWAAAHEQMVQATNGFVAAALQCHSQQQVLVKQHNSATRKAAELADRNSWAAVDQWQSQQRRRHQQQQAQPESLRTAVADGASRQDLNKQMGQQCALQLQVHESPDADSPHVKLQLIVSEAGRAAADATSCDESASSDADASAALRQRLLRIEAAVAAEIGRAADSLAGAVGTKAAELSKLCEEHLQKMLQHEAAYDTACREAAALPPEKRAAGRQRGATGSRRSSTMPARKSSMAPLEPAQAMSHQELLQLADASLEAHSATIQEVITSCQHAQQEDVIALADLWRQKAADRSAARAEEIGRIAGSRT